jgi:predicted anti-sigma-YlaC factor YlaD
MILGVLPSCREVYDFLDDFIEGRLPMATKARFLAHLAICAPCRDYLATYKATKRVAIVASRAFADDEPQNVPEELIQAIIASSRG